MLPFDNRTDQPNLDWISEAIPEVLNRRLASAGFLPISRDDRLYALDHLGLPSTFQPSRASAIRLAQTLDADYLIVGSFSTTGARFQAKAQVLNVESLHMSAAIQEEADMAHLLDVLNSLAWGLAKQLDPQFAVARNTFVAAGAGLRVDAFENYTRGLVEPDPDEQIRHLKEAVRLDPAFSPALLARGRPILLTSNSSWPPPHWDECRATTPMPARPTSIAAWLISIWAVTSRRKTPSLL